MTSGSEFSSELDSEPEPDPELDSSSDSSPSSLLLEAPSTAAEGGGGDINGSSGDGTDMSAVSGRPLRTPLSDAGGGAERSTSESLSDDTFKSSISRIPPRSQPRFDAE